jgi:3',5'-nucleoside bisphosphate phosphatase
MIGEWLLCDFHIHTRRSDGRLPLHDIVDHFGKAGFDVIAITDHAVDRAFLEGVLKRGEKIQSVGREDFDDYLRSLWHEARRAWEKYDMLLIPGLELSNNTDKYHILGIDVKEYIDPSLPVEKIIEEIHRQSGIAVACHPHTRAHDPGYPYLYLWERHERFAPLFDAWEVGNRDDLFNVVGLKKFNYIANSDFHEEWHLYSWKTLIHAEKNTEAVKEAIRNNSNVALHLFRKGKPFQD